MSTFDEFDAQTNGNGGGDAVLDALMKAFDGIEEAEYRPQEDHLPKGQYLLALKKAKGETRPFKVGDPPRPRVRLGYQVVEGKVGVKRYVWIDHELKPSTEAFDETTRTYRPATPEEYKKNEAMFAGGQKRFQRVHGLATPLPLAYTVEAIEGWLKPAIDKVMIVADVDVTGKDKNRNRIAPYKMQSPDDEVYADPKTKKKSLGKAIDLLRKSLGQKPGVDTASSSDALA